MWIKLTIILFIITICSYLFAKVMYDAMEPSEKLSAALGHPPNKVTIPCVIAVLSGIAAVGCLIVTIITW